MPEPTHPHDSRPPSDDAPVAGPRRDFLKASAAAAGATLLASCFGGGGGSEDAPLLGGTEVDPLSRFDHLVVVMFENRSFDNLLGYLYSRGATPADWPSSVPVPPPVPAGQSFDGLFGKVHHSDDGAQKIYAHPHDFAPGSPAPKWKVYFEKPASESERQTYPYGLTGLVHPEVSRKYAEKFVDYAKFADDVAKGVLPAYSFIERVYGGHDDFHPPGDVRNGEEVLRQIYETIRTSGTSGPHDYTQDTLLLVVFGEHGGTYDHIAPATTGVPAPSSPPVPGELGYDFTSLGLRVPAIAISAYTPAGTVVNAPVHHAAVIRTLCRKYGLPALTDRDRDPNGGDLSGALGGAMPRSAASWPAYPNPYSPPAG